MKNKIWITGINGVLAKYLALEMESLGYVVIPLHHDLEEANKSFEQHKNEAFALIHCAFARNENIDELESSVEFTRRITQAMIQYRIPNVINISSQSVYENSKDIVCVNEEVSVYPSSNYAKAKLKAENLFLEICKNNMIDGSYSSIRLGSLIAPELQQRIVNRLIDIGRNSGELHIQNSQRAFQYLDVRDAVNGIAKMLGKCGKWNELYCLTAKRTLELGEIARSIREYAKSKNCDVEISYEENKQCFNFVYVQSEKFRCDFDWKERYDISDSIQYIWEAR